MTVPPREGQAERTISYIVAAFLDQWPSARDALPPATSPETALEQIAWSRQREALCDDILRFAARAPRLDGTALLLEGSELLARVNRSSRATIGVLMDARTPP